MIKPIELYTVECDNCKEIYQDDLIFAWVDGENAQENACENGGWVWEYADEEETKTAHYCPKCQNEIHLDLNEFLPGGKHF